ncbi:hypothetical protein B0H13DRAFT_2343920 [Mycena leptocephala]|nr:hypothetical protein B0H13DRAFT_2343920 [Mycena leptocephala]
MTDNITDTGEDKRNDCAPQADDNDEPPPLEPAHNDGPYILPDYFDYCDSPRASYNPPIASVRLAHSKLNTSFVAVGNTIYHRHNHHRDCQVGVPEERLVDPVFASFAEPSSPLLAVLHAEPFPFIFVTDGEMAE